MLIPKVMFSEKRGEQGLLRFDGGVRPGLYCKLNNGILLCNVHLQKDGAQGIKNDMKRNATVEHLYKMIDARTVDMSKAAALRDSIDNLLWD